MEKMKNLATIANLAAKAEKETCKLFFEAVSITKGNDSVRIGLKVTKEGEEQITPIIYPAEGSSVEEVLKMAEAAFAEKESILGGEDGLPKDLLVYDQVKSLLRAEICEAAKNRERAKGKISVENGPFLELYSIRKGDAKVLVTEDLLKLWGVSANEVREAALQNEASQIGLFDMLDMVSSSFTHMMPEDLLHTEDPIRIRETDPMFVLTTSDATFGASALLNKDVLKKISEKMGGDFYVLPSSIHEVLVVPVEGCPMPPEELDAMVQEVNEQEVTPEERLLSYALVYKAGTGAIEKAS